MKHFSPLRAIVVTSLLLFTNALAADERRATVVTKKARQSGTLVTPPIKIKVGNAAAPTAVPLADITLIEFGETDAIRTKSRRDPLKGKIDLTDWKFRDEKGDKDAKAESPIDRENLRFIIPHTPPGPLQKGKIVDAAAANGMTYHVRVPPNYNPTTGGPAIILFHGSNANSNDYVFTVAQAWPKLAADYVLIGINGEWPSNPKPGDPLRYNFTYVNFVGKSRYKGFPGTDRESPALVAEVIAEIKEHLKLTKIFVGGHSQGAFLTYSCIMNYPELFAGAFPISGGLIMQAEPTAYDNPDLRARQRQVALAIVHGQSDDLVSPQMATDAHESFVADGFPAVRLLLQQNRGHMFATLPVQEAILWLASMTSDQPAALLDTAQKAFTAKQYRDAFAALQRAQSLDQGAKHAAAIKSLRDKLESAATAAAKPVEAAMRDKKGDAWVPDFVAFRTQFDQAEAAKPILAEYQKLRDLHEKPAQKLWSEARKAFGEGARDQGFAKCEEIVKSYYASTVYRYAKRSLDQRR
jgi:predicted esterase